MFFSPMKIPSFLKFLGGINYPIKTNIEKNITEVTM